MSEELKLKVMEAVQDDVNKGIVRLDSGFMKTINVNEGEIVEVKGEKVTAAVVRRGYPGDINLNIVRMDGDTRRNAKTSIGEFVTIEKTEVIPAKRIVVGRLGHVPPIRHDFLKSALLNRPLMKNDIISLRRDRPKVIRQGGIVIQVQENFLGFGAAVKLFVSETNPAKGIVTVNQDTELVFDPRASFKEEEETLTLGVNYEDIGGLGEEIKKVREMIELPLKHPEIFERLGIEPPKGVLLHGPPGTGKTLLAKAVASETQSHFILINGPEVMSKFYGESEANLRKKFDEAEQNAPSIIFLDEIDAIATKREETKGDVEKRVVAQLLGLMDGLKSRGKVIVIAATNMPNVVDPALRRPGRFDREIEIGVPGKEGRLEVLKIHTRNMPLAKNVNLKEMAKITHGFVGADLNALAKESAMIVLRRILPDLKKAGIEEGDTIPEDILAKLMVTQKDFMESLKIVRPSAMREVLVETPDVNWSDVGGLEVVKDKLKEAVEWPLKTPEVFEKMGIRPPRGILLYGPPGTGKTLLAKAVAKEAESNFILVNGPSLLSKWVGESEKAVREIFRKARQTSPTILFFDEIDALVPRRGGSSEGHRVSEKMVNQMLTEMDGLESLNDVVVIAATNRPDIVDPALLRQGRFDRIIFTPVPDVEGRKKIFEIYVEGMPVAKDVDIIQLADKTEGYVGADIEGVCREAAMIALRENMGSKEITLKHFEEALNVVKPSVDKEVEEAYDKLADYFSAARAKQIKHEKADYFG